MVWISPHSPRTVYFQGQTLNSTDKQELLDPQTTASSTFPRVVNNTGNLIEMFNVRDKLILFTQAAEAECSIPVHDSLISGEPTDSPTFINFCLLLPRFCDTNSHIYSVFINLWFKAGANRRWNNFSQYPLQNCPKSIHFFPRTLLIYFYIMTT